MNTAELRQLPGVLAVITIVDATPVLIDVDSASNVLESASDHPRRKVWRRLSKPVGYAFVVRYQNTEDTKTPEALVEEIRGAMDVLCGK